MRFERLKLRQCLAGFVSTLMILAPIAPAHAATPPAKVTKAPSQLQALMDSYSRNTIPNLLDPVQEKSFEFYIKNNFEGQVDIANPLYFDQVKKIIKIHDLEPKELFGAVEVQLSAPTYPVSPELKRYASDMIKGMGTLKALFLEPAANLGLWTKLKDEGQPVFDSAAIDLLLGTVGASVSLDHPVPLLKSYRDLFKKMNLSDSARKRMMQSLIQLLAIANPGVVSGLRSDRGEDVIAALKAYVGIRLHLEREYGDPLDLHLRQLIVKVPILTKEKVRQDILRLEAELREGPVTLREESFLVRPLSVIEAPFRSCLSSSDCSTKLYLDRAFDPAFYYFTVTDSENHSRGNITLALGDAHENGHIYPVALIDKVQEIDPSKLDVVLEAVRQSVEKQGYQLVLQTPLPDFINSMSNFAAVIETLKVLPTYTDQRQVLTQYKTHASLRRFTSGESLSHAFKTFNVKPLLPLPSIATSADRQVSWNVRKPLMQKQLRGSLSIEAIDEEIDRLKSGTLEERLIYIELMDTVIQAQIKSAKSAEYESVLISWIRDRNSSLRLRQRALKVIANSYPWDLSELWPAFTSSQIQTTLLNWHQTHEIGMSSEIQGLIYLSAIPYFDPTDGVLERLIDSRRFYGLNETALQALVQSAKKPHVRALFKEIGIVQAKDTDVMRRFGSLVLTLTLYDALVEAESQGNMRVADDLRPIVQDRLKDTFHRLGYMQLGELQQLATRIGPFLQRPQGEKTFLDLVDAKIEDLKPLVRSNRLWTSVSMASFGSTVAFSIFTAYGFYGVMSEMIAPNPHNLAVIGGSAALAGLGRLTDFVASKKRSQNAYSESAELKRWKLFKKAAELAMKKGDLTCSDVLSVENIR